MKSIFVLLLKKTLEIKTYTSLQGVVLEFSKEEIGVSRSKLEKYDFNIPYENDIIRIEKSATKTAGDVRREKQQKK